MGRGARWCWAAAGAGVVGMLGASCGSTDVTCEDTATCAGPVGGPDASSDGKSDSSSDSAPPNETRDGADTGADAGMPASDGATQDETRPEAEAGPSCDRTRLPNEDPCVIADMYGVFVWTRADAGAGDGSRARPLTSLMAAVKQAKATGRRVYACDDGPGYAEQLVIDASLDGVELYGGFTCDWRYMTGQRAVVTAPTPVAATVTKLTAGLRIQDFSIRAANAATRGDSSVALFVSESRGIKLVRVTLTAGKGMDGDSATALGAPAQAGAPGAKGNDACQTLKPILPGATMCGTEASAGGNGGLGATGPGNGNSGGTGTPTSVPPMPTGKGEGEVAGTLDCLSSDHGMAQGGALGIDGTAGAGAVGVGTLDATGWHPARAAAGLDGHVGQGGGGGGGARAPATCVGFDASSPTGASGGSGGAGGCGGKGGGAGISGGSSIALASFNSTVQLDSCDLVASAGGKGGDGAHGQQGGDGGRGGDHGVGNVSSAGCDGARGGRGGMGGPGGGGSGGSSIGIAYVGTAPGAAMPVVGTPGAGGRDGNGQSSGPGAGASGVAQMVLEIH